MATKNVLSNAKFQIRISNEYVFFHRKLCAENAASWMRPLLASISTVHPVDTIDISRAFASIESFCSRNYFAMSLLRLAIGRTCGSLPKFVENSATQSSYCISAAKFSNFLTQQPNFGNKDNEEHEAEGERAKFRPRQAMPASKDRSVKIDVETSIRYLQSDAYKQTYGNHLVWHLYRRNHKGALAPKRTRRACIKQNEIKTGSPCPICRDPYLVLHHTNLALLRQFISPHSGEVGVALINQRVFGLR